MPNPKHSSPLKPARQTSAQRLTQLAPPQLANALQRHGYQTSNALEQQLFAALHTKPCAGCFLTGPAGSGKTMLAETLARIAKRQLFFFQAFPGCRKEELLQTLLPDDTQASGFKVQAGILLEAAHASTQGPSVLVLDEWDKAHPSSDAFLLDFFQNGRISLPGMTTQADLSALWVFVTLNDERELSEPLLRRLPLLEIPTPTTTMVRNALVQSHPQHPALNAALALHQRGQMVELSKPVTIQELRQLLDAITVLGEGADWNSLVFQFVTKNWDDHAMLKSTENKPLTPADQTPAVCLDASRYEAPALGGEDAANQPASMPQFQREWMKTLQPKALQADPTQIYGVVPATQGGYDGVARALLANRGTHSATDKAEDLRIAKVGETEIFIYEALRFENPQEWVGILREGGELLLEARHAGDITLEMLLRFKAEHMNPNPLQTPPAAQAQGRIYSLTTQEVLMRYGSLKLRWTPTLLEVAATRYAETYTLWDFLYGAQGCVVQQRQQQRQLLQAQSATDHRQPAEGSLNPPAPALDINTQMLGDYLRILEDTPHLQQWFSLWLQRNLSVWQHITCQFDSNLGVINAQGGVSHFASHHPAPDESPQQASARADFQRKSAPSHDYFAHFKASIQSELLGFIRLHGDLPVGVEEGNIFGHHEVDLDMLALKKKVLAPQQQES